MKNINLLVWLTQLGISVALPLVGFVLLGVWLHTAFGWGKWVIVLGVVLGVYSAINGLWGSLKILERLSEKEKK